jgi:hypothetical protein
VPCTAVTETYSHRYRDSGILNHINLWILFFFINITLKLLLILNFLVVISEGGGGGGAKI